MSFALAARLDAASSIAARFGRQAAVAVICGGSTGRGHADRWSDLELGVYWSELPELAERRAALLDLSGRDPRLFPYDLVSRACFDEWWHQGGAGAGLLVEVIHMTMSDAQALLDRLLVDVDADPQLLAYASAIAYGRVLQGYADDLTERVRVYPRDLAIAVVRRHGQVDNFWRWRMYVDRGNSYGLRVHFANTVPLWPTYCAR